MMSDERDPLTGAYSISKLTNDLMAGTARKLMVAAIVNIKQITDAYGLGEGDESIKKLSGELSGAYGDRVYRINTARFVVKDPDLSRLFNVPNVFSKKETVASCVVRVDEHDISAVEIKSGKDLLKTLNGIRLDDMGDPWICIKFVS